MTCTEGAPFIFIHQPGTEAEHGLALAGLLLTHYPKRVERRLSAKQRATVAMVQDRLCRDHRAGRLPVGDICALWLDTPPTRRTTPEAIKTSAWLRERMRTRATFSLRVP
jgi:hypothetical protein